MADKKTTNNCHRNEILTYERKRTMKKLLFKMFMPKPADLAKIVARAAADFVNSSGRE